MNQFEPAQRVRSQLASFLQIPNDWNAENAGDTIILTGPAGLRTTLPNKKSDFLPEQWRAAAAAAVLAASPAERGNGRVPLAEFLSLPEGWKATTFPSTIEMEGPDGARCAIPLPNNPTARQTLIIQAHQSILTCQPTKS